MDSNYRPASTRRRIAFVQALSFLLVALLVLAGCSTSAESSAESRSETKSRVSRSTSAASRVSSRATDAHGTAAVSKADTGHQTGQEEVHAKASGDAPHWTYEGSTGPSHWGDLADEFIACKAGTSQSPIDILGSIQAQPASIQFGYHDSPLRILNNGHTLQINYDPGSSITIGHDQYELLQFHFHTPSEHQVSAHNFPMEGHLVHKDTNDRLAVVGVFIEEGHSNPFFQALVDNLPHNAGQEDVISSVHLNAEDMLPHDRDIYTYSGSLTTPPCSEGVSWNVMSTPIEMSGEQIAAFSAIMGHNNRPVQALNDRAISGQGIGDVQVAARAGHDEEPDEGGHGEAVHWGYGDIDGPHVWGDLSPEYSTCATGAEQSPVNIQKALTTEAKDKSVFTTMGTPW